MSLELTPGFPDNSHVPFDSFTELLRAADVAPRWEVPSGAEPISLPEATTVLAMRFSDGVVMVGDRRATEGHSIAHRRIQKVFPADRYSAVAIAGTAGLAMEMVRLFQTELEHYEKLEGVRLSLEGKANHLARMVRQQLPMVFQGLIVVPLFCGYDEEAGRGRIFTYDVVGGRYEEEDYAASGSGSREAKAYLRAVFTDGFDRERAMEEGVAAIAAAADQDTATAGPDLRREIYPSVVIVDSIGYNEVEDAEVADISRRVLDREVR